MNPNTLISITAFPRDRWRRRVAGQAGCDRRHRRPRDRYWRRRGLLRARTHSARSRRRLRRTSPAPPPSPAGSRSRAGPGPVLFLVSFTLLDGLSQALVGRAGPTWLEDELGILATGGVWFAIGLALLRAARRSPRPHAARSQVDLASHPRQHLGAAPRHPSGCRPRFLGSAPGAMARKWAE